MLLGTCGALTAGFVGGAQDARATCFSSAPANATFSDPAGDTTGADILQVEMTLDGGCGVTIEPLLDASRGSGLAMEDVIFTSINTDGDKRTGDKRLGGADRSVIAYPNAPPTLFGCTRTPCEFEEIGVLTTIGVAGFATGLDQLGVKTSGRLEIVVAALFLPLNPVHWELDLAPDEPPPYPLEVNISDAPSHSTVPPVFLPALPSLPKRTFPTRKVKAKKCNQRQGCWSRRCTVPRLIGKTVPNAKRELKREHCKYKVNGRGRVVSTHPRAGSKTTGRVQVKARKDRP